MSDKLTISNLKKSYFTLAEPLAVLDSINFEIKRGQSVSIIGESGAGKSTLLNLIGGLDFASSGNINIFGTQIENLSEDALAKFRNKLIGFVFQYHHLLPDFNTLENAIIPALISGTSKKKAEKKAINLLTNIGLKDRLLHKPSQLSGGEQQRVAVVRALMNNPELILMDEPTGNLDYKTGESVLDMIFKIKEETGLTLIIITHNMEIARKTDICIKLSRGGANIISLS